MRRKTCCICHADVPPGWVEVTWRQITTLKLDGPRIDHGQQPYERYFCDEHPPDK